MTSNNTITQPPDERRGHHLDGANSNRCSNRATEGNGESLPTPSVSPPPSKGGLRGVRMEEMVDNLFFIQGLLAGAIKSQAEAEALDILTLAELSRDYTHNALNITRTLREKQALEAPQNEWSLLLAELSLELEEEDP